jgi:fimbrial isopeptide formation D2 family protein/LPXTG-motif cell wall-anchored protein
MKSLKKMMALVIAMVMVLAMGVTVFAAKDTAHTIKITSDATQKQDHTYQAYQVFVGTYDTTSKQLQNFEWGSGVDSAALLTELKKTAAYAACETAAQVAAVLDGKADDSTEAKAFAEAVNKCLGTATAFSGNKTDGYTADVTGDGYYFIKDTTTNLESGDTLSSFMLQVIGDVNVKAKDSTTESSKKVKDADDTAGTTTDWQDSADYDIGDKVPFKLTGKVAGDYDKYTTYTFIFHDKEGTGLTFNNDAKVSVDGTEITSGFEVKTTGLTDGDTFEVVFEDLKQVASVSAGSVITVEYTSTLNDNAVIGQKGNPNTSHIEFSNNPNSDQEGTGKTPDDTVIVFTYRSTVTKVDENSEPLNGADFTLYKEVQSTFTGAKTGAAIKADFSDNVKAKATALADAKYYVEVTNKDGTSSSNTFSFKGIDDGNYVLVETTVPTGYNAWAATAFTVTATHTATSDIDPETGKVPSSTTYILTELDGGDLFTGDLGTTTLADEKADLDTTITNQSGAVLPETGGIGTTIFYIVGAILVLGAGILLVTRRRMNAN